MAKGRPNIRDVARESGVSLTTVSLVLNKNDQRISEATRKRVLEAMRKLHYTPSRLARGLPTRRAKTLAVLLPALQHAFADVYFGEIISGIYESAADRGYRILLEVARRDYVQRQEYRMLLEDCSVDGILFIGATDEHTWLSEFNATGQPLMVVNNYFPHWDLHTTVCEYTLAGRLASDHLVRLGHTRIGHISGPTSLINTARELSDAFLASLAKCGIRLSEQMIVEGQYHAETGKLACEELLRRDPSLTAIFAANDKMAIGAYQALREAGRQPGRDVAVLGCDDIPSAALADPALSTIRMNFFEVGAEACNALLNLIESNPGDDEKPPTIHERIPVSLIERESCCSPPATEPVA